MSVSFPKFQKKKKSCRVLVVIPTISTLKIVAEAEAVNNNREIAREYEISVPMVRKWRYQQHVLFNWRAKDDC